jgi:serine protease
MRIRLLRGSSRRAVLGAVLLLSLSACPNSGLLEPPPPPPSSSYGVSGSVRLSETTTANGRSLQPRGVFDARAVQESEFIPGELIVGFDSGVRTQDLDALSVNGVRLEAVRSLGLQGVLLLRRTGLDRRATLELASQVAMRGDVAFVQPNFIRRRTVRPNDAYFDDQWDLGAMNLPLAWDITTGQDTSGVIVGVVDTGILSGHPDLQGRMLPGYDFISNPKMANDGDGRDANPEDAGDDPGRQSSYHGSHVTGTLAATSDNALGIAGVTWGARVVPARVLGVGGGTTADIIDAGLWLSGFSVNGVPANAHPVSVINMSLGGSGSCDQSPAEQAAIDRITARGVSIVVSAGNENLDARGYAPASCGGVITVGASNREGSRANYSNFGTRIDVMAPGGDAGAGVLSTVRDDSTGQYGYANKMGTSMAAPHVAGLVALMKSLRADLTPPQILEILRRTARPLSAAACNRLTGAECGAGVVDARAALEAVSGAQPPTLTLAGAQVFACVLRTDGYCREDLVWYVTLKNTERSASYALAGLERRRHAIYAWKDLDGDDALSQGDLFGLHLKAVLPPASNIDLVLEPYFPSNATGATRGAARLLEHRGHSGSRR